MGFFLIVGGVIGATVAWTIWSGVREQRSRTAQLQALGFHEEPETALGETKGLDLFDFSRPILLTKVAVRDDLALFDITYRSGKRHTTIVAFKVPSSVPDFTLRNKPPTGKATTMQMRAEVVVSLSGIDLEMQGLIKPLVDVGRDVTVRSFDEAGVRRVLTPAALDALAHLDPSVSVEKGSRWLIYYGESSRARADQWPVLIEEARRFVRLLNLA